MEQKSWSLNQWREAMLDYAEENNWRLLIHINDINKITMYIPYICACGTEYKSRKLNNILNFEKPMGCVHCRRNQIRENLEKVYLEKNCKLISTPEEYKDGNSSLKYIPRCCDVPTRCQYKAFIKGNGKCHRCAKKPSQTEKIKDIDEILVSKNCVYLMHYSQNQRTYVEYKCQCGNISATSISNLRKDKNTWNGCKSCVNRRRANNGNGITVESLKLEFASKKCVLLSNEYINQNTLLDFICSCGAKSQITRKQFIRCKSTDGVCRECLIFRKQKTNMEKYNAPEYFQSTDFLQKTTKTCMQKYNNPHHSQSETIKTLKLQTMKTVHNEQYAFLSKDAKIKSKHSYQSNDKLCTFKLKEYILPSGDIIKLQGNEHRCLDILLDCYSEDEICCGLKNVPIIEYQIPGQDSTSLYFPDFYIKSTNTIIEVKSPYTLYANIYKNCLKFKKVIEDGFNFILIVFHGSKLVRYKIGNDHFMLYCQSVIDNYEYPEINEQDLKKYFKSKQLALEKRKNIKTRFMKYLENM